MALKTDKMDFNKMKTIFFFALIIILGITVIYLFRPFFYPIFWAAVIAITFYPIYQWLLHHLKFKALSSSLALIITLVIILLPLAIFSTLVINQSIGLYQSAAQGNLLGQVQNLNTWLLKTPLAPYLEHVKNNWVDYAQNAAQTISLFLFDNLKNLTQISLQFLFQLFIMCYTLYYFFKDGPRMLKRLMHLSPLGDNYEEMLYERFTSTARATLKGTLLVGCIQGALGGLLFWVTGIQGALIWGVIMTAASLIPALGTFIVWFPAGVIMLALGNIWQGVAILIFGLLVVSTIDNFIKPVLVGKDIEIHPLVVLFSTLGGIYLFGISGIVIGPILAALFLAVINIYEHYYKTELQNN